MPKENIHYSKNMKFTRKHISEMPKLRNTYSLSFDLIQKEGMTAIYMAKRPSGVNVYEIMLFDVDRKTGGLITPSTGKWGTDAFTTLTLERAEMRFKQLRQKEISREILRKQKEENEHNKKTENHQRRGHL